MSAFASGFKMGGDMYDSTERMRLMQAQEARAAEAHQQSQKEGALRIGALERVDGATSRLNDAVTRGLAVPGSEVAAPAGYEMMDPGQGPQYRAATDADIAGLTGALAAAKGDAQGVLTSRAQAKQFKQTEEDRAWIRSMQELHDKATRKVVVPKGSESDGGVVDEQAVQAWAQVAQPYMNMVSQHKGLEFDARVNPKTGAIEIVPYQGGGVQPVNFNDALPYLMASRQLTSEYGDPTKAIEALASMSKDKQKALLDASTGRLQRAALVGKSINDANVAESGRITATANASSAQSLSELRGLQAQAIRDAGANRERAAAISAQFEALTPEEQAGPKGRGLILEFNLLNAKPGGQLTLGRSGTGKEGKPEKVEAQGTRFTRDGKLYEADGYGNEIPLGSNGKPLGVFPDQRLAEMKKAGLSDNDIAELPWSSDGSMVLFNNKGYRWLDPKDRAALKKDIQTHQRDSASSAENIRGLQTAVGGHGEYGESGFGPALTYRPDQMAPSIYASPDEWAKYRQFQQRGQ